MPTRSATLFAERGDEIAAVITEPAAANMGVVPPEPGFNAAAPRADRAPTARCSSTTRCSPGSACPPPAGGGWRAASSPTCSPSARWSGGGMPLAALGGRAELMDLLAPLGPVYQAGTLSGNPLATAAGIATLRLADADVYARVDAAADRARRARSPRPGRGRACRTCCSGPGRCSPCSSGRRPRRCATTPSAQRQDTGAYRAFFHAMLDAGVALPPSAYEAWFLSAAHDDAALDGIVDAHCRQPRRPRPRALSSVLIADPVAAWCSCRRRWCT